MPSYVKAIILCIFFMFLISCEHKIVIHPQRKDIVETVYASGKIIADSEYTVLAQSAGTIERKLVKEGDSVKSHQVLFIISHDAQVSKLAAAEAALEEARTNLSRESGILRDLRLSVENAQAKLTNDSLQYVRLKNLWSENIGSKSNVDNAYSTYLTSMNLKKSAEEKYTSTLNDLNVSLQNAKSQVSTARTELNNYLVRSQDNGTVYQTYREEGETVRLNDALALLGKTTRRIIRLAVDQQDIDKIRLGQEVLVKTDITGNNIYHATILRIYPTMNEADQTFRSDAVFNDDILQRFIHSSVEANIIIQTKKNALVVPSNAFPSTDSLQVRENGRIKLIGVKTGIRSLDETEIVSGVNEASQIIVPAKR